MQNLIKVVLSMINLSSALNTIMIIKCTVGSNLVPRVPGNEVEWADDFITAKGSLLIN
jgi:hypothetical protein